MNRCFWCSFFPLGFVFLFLGFAFVCLPRALWVCGWGVVVCIFFFFGFFSVVWCFGVCIVLVVFCVVSNLLIFVRGLLQRGGTFRGKQPGGEIAVADIS